MSDHVDPTRPVTAERRRAARRSADPAPPPQLDGERANFPTIAAGRINPPAPEPQRGDGVAIFAAQVIGQDGQKRGLRGGAPVLDQARSAYLGAEYSGRADRRPPRGRLTKTDI